MDVGFGHDDDKVSENFFINDNAPAFDNVVNGIGDMKVDIQGAMANIAGDVANSNEIVAAVIPPLDASSG